MVMVAVVVLQNILDVWIELKGLTMKKYEIKSLHAYIHRAHMPFVLLSIL